MRWIIGMYGLSVAFGLRAWADTSIVVSIAAGAAFTALCAFIAIAWNWERSRRRGYRLLIRLNQGDLDGYLRELDRWAAAAAERRDRDALRRARLLQAAGLAEFDRADEAYAQLRALSMHDAPTSDRMAWEFQMGHALSLKGAASVAEPHLANLERARDRHSRTVYVPYLRGVIAGTSGRPKEGVEILTGAIAAMQKAGHPGWELAELRCLGFLRLADPAAATARAERFAQRASTTYLADRARHQSRIYAG